MKVITFADIKKLAISPACCYQWIDEMIQNKADALLPAKISMKPMNEVFCNVMPCIIQGESSKICRGGGKGNYALS